MIQGCCSYDTRIQTKELGFVKIGSVVNQNLTIWDGKDWTKGFIAYTGKKKLCRVHFTGGQIFECSPTHKFLVRSHKGNERFVECKDLINRTTEKGNRNGHRVVITQNYVPSDYIYNSNEYHKFASKSPNAHNLYVDNMSDRFGSGVVLGRLASDGNITYRTTGGSTIRQIIAEHEFSIIPILEHYMRGFKWVHTRIGQVRDGRTQKLAHITVSSKSLVKELLTLDIKHKIHDNIFMDTEMLRGFLCGFFDGDGGISGKTITLVFGKQYDFEPL